MTIKVRQKCSCGEYLLDEEKEGHRKGCLAYLINGATGELNITATIQPVYPIKYILTTFAFDENTKS